MTRGSNIGSVGEVTQEMTGEVTGNVRGKYQKK